MFLYLNRFRITSWSKMSCQFYIFIIAAQEGREILGKAASKNTEEEGRIWRRQSQEEGNKYNQSVISEVR